MTQQSLPFPYPVLTPIIDAPAIPSLKKLKREMYANALAITSKRGGGKNGHLALVMPSNKYLARPNAEFFTPPPHPGEAPATATSTPMVIENHRVYNAKLKEHDDFTVVVGELKKQLLAAVPDTYLAILADDEMGYADVSCLTIVTHLDNTYGTVTAEDLEANRNSLSDPWNLDWPQEDLWTRINTAQTFAAANQDPITDAAAISLTLAVFEKAAMYRDQTIAWRIANNTNATLANFREFFTRAAKEHRRTATAQTAGYHGAHATTNTTPAPTIVDLSSPNIFRCIHYYCHTHGYTKNPNHTSLTCNDKKAGHKDAATGDKRMGGCSDVYVPRERTQLQSRS